MLQRLLGRDELTLTNLFGTLSTFVFKGFSDDSDCPSDKSSPNKSSARQPVGSDSESLTHRVNPISASTKRQLPQPTNSSLKQTATNNNNSNKSKTLPPIPPLVNEVLLKTSKYPLVRTAKKQSDPDTSSRAAQENDDSLFLQQTSSQRKPPQSSTKNRLLSSANEADHDDLSENSRTSSRKNEAKSRRLREPTEANMSRELDANSQRRLDSNTLSNDSSMDERSQVHPRIRWLQAFHYVRQQIVSVALFFV